MQRHKTTKAENAQMRSEKGLNLLLLCALQKILQQKQKSAAAITEEIHTAAFAVKMKESTAAAKDKTAKNAVSTTNVLLLMEFFIIVTWKAKNICLRKAKCLPYLRP